MNSVAKCGTSISGGPRRLGAADAAVIIVVLVLAAAMSAVTSAPPVETLALLLGAGAVGAQITALAVRERGGIPVVARGLSVAARR